MFPKILSFVIVLAVACGGKAASGTDSAAEAPYCSASQGPLTAEQAASVKDATLCPPPYQPDVLSAMCVTNWNSGGNSAPSDGGAGDASVAEWGCSIEIASGP
jgi:hypothetical protein